MSSDSKLFLNFRTKSKYRKVARDMCQATANDVSSSSTSRVLDSSPCQPVDMASCSLPINDPTSRNLSPLSDSANDISVGPVTPPPYLDSESLELDSSNLLQLVDSSPESDFSDEEDAFIDVSDPVESLKDELRKWSAKFNITLVALSALLCILRAHCCFSSLPKDARSVLQTPASVEIKDVPPGQYHHVGLRKSLIKMLENVAVQSMECREIIIGIDGLPLFNSAGCEVWPILAWISNLPSAVSSVFPIGLYVGAKKPNECASFLAEFIAEAKDLMVNGLLVKGVHLAVKIKGFSLDAPAKAFVFNIKGHNGYSSCTRCKQEGEYYANRMTFPEFTGTARTSADFLTYEDKDFHRGLTPLSILGVLGFDLVRGVCLDYLHLVCLGVVRTLLFTWLFGKVPLKLSVQCVKNISEKLILMGAFKPFEFCRRHRSLEYAKRFKGTEFRQLLLYTGPIVLEEHLNEEHFTHFLSLHVGMTILLNPRLKNQYRDYAKELLKHFVECTGIFYGQEFLTHNFHGLLHIADDLDHFDSLDDCSAFKFENYLGWLKQLVRKGQSVLQQLVKRLSERSFRTLTVEESLSVFPKLLHQHSYGPLPANCRNPQYRFLSQPSFKLSIEKPNNCCGLESGKIVSVENIAYAFDADKPVIIGREFLKRENLYTDPCESSRKGIYEVSELSSLKVFPVSDITVKYYLLPTSKNYAVFPILHTEQ